MTNKNINLLPICSEKISAVLKDCITKSIWVITFASQNGTLNSYNTFHAFEVNNTGVNTTAVVSPFNLNITDPRGYLKLSPDGTKLANANMRDGLFLYNFDVTTGIVSNQQTLTISGQSNRAYGVEFSQNNQFLYIHSSNDYFNQQDQNENNNPANHSSSLTQFDLNASDIQASEFTIDERQLFRGSLQLAADGRIYRALSATYNVGLPYLGIINNPDNLGLSCNYIHNGINISPNLSAQGLPPFIASFFNTQIDIIKNGKSSINLELCDGDIYNLSSEYFPGATYIWIKDGTLLSETSFNLDVNISGHYEVYIQPNNGDCAIEGQAFVNFNENPEAFNSVLLQCDEDGTKDGFTLFNLNEASETLTGGIQDTSTKFYSDITKLNTISNPESYNNISNPQTIYVDVINDRTGCSSDSQLFLNVSLTDSNDTELIACDDDGTEDGKYNFKLREADSKIINGLPNGLVISYYTTYEDALIEQNNLGDTFFSYSQTIYARVENTNNCYGISKLLLTVNKLPEIKTDDIAYYCLNKYPETITIEASVLNDSPNNYTYSWSTGESTYEIQVNEPGTYKVLVTNSNNCSQERTVIVEPANIASFESINVVDATQNNIITVFVSGEGTYEYSLLDSDNILYRPYQNSNVFENIAPGFYTVYVKDSKNNCGIVNTKVSVIGFPKYFTPNNDGVNDRWQVYGVSDKFQPNSLIYIYDRYGKLLKQLMPSQPGWDGLFNGQKLPSDDYWFHVKLQDGRVFKSHFSLKN